MSRQGLSGISQVIKANTTEKSIDELRAEGKKRVRVVSSERVMAIIQAIVDDTIASEVGEITKRDRDRIVSDTQARFSHVLGMQQDLEATVEELRTALREAELDRDRMSAAMGLLESRLEVANLDGKKHQGLGQTLEELRASLRAAELERERLRADKVVLETQLGTARRDDKTQQDLERSVGELRGSLRSAELERERLRADKALLEKQLEAARLDGKAHADVERSVDELRASLRSAELERERLRADKALLETQVETARRDETEADAVGRLSRDLARVREAVERMPRDTGTVDEAMLGRVVEKLAARDTQNLRRLGTEFEDLRSRLEAVARDAVASRDTAVDKALVRAKEQQSQTDAQLVARLDREFRTVSDHLAEIRGELGRSPAADDVSRLRGNVDTLESRLHGVERSSQELADRVAKSVLERIEAREAASADRRKETSLAEAAQVTETIRRLQQASDENRQTILHEVGTLRETVEDGRTLALSVQAEQLRDLAQRITESASEGTGVLASTLERIEERATSLDGPVQGLRRDLGRDLTAVVERAAADNHAAREGSLQDLRRDFASVVQRSAADNHAARVGSLQDLRLDLAGVVERSASENKAARDGSLQGLRHELAGVVERAVNEKTDELHGSIKGLHRDLAGVVERTASENKAAREGQLADLRAELAGVVERTVAEKTGELHGTIKGMHRDLTGVVERAVAESTTAPAVVTEALDGVRLEAVQAAMAAARTAEHQAALSARVDGSLTELRGEFMALTAKSIEAAERQHEAVKSLREHIAQNAAVQSGSLETSFKGALRQALDKITRTMERATARPIESSGEATEVLLAKIFDGTDGEMTSNLDQIDVHEQRSKSTVAKNIGRLKEMNSVTKSGTE